MKQNLDYYETKKNIFEKVVLWPFYIFCFISKMWYFWGFPPPPPPSSNNTEDSVNSLHLFIKSKS